ncbi:MAG: hypothetical protein ABSD78_10400 [Acidimicrobiales bacterium]
MAERAHTVLDLARREVGLSHSQLWMRYFALGGMSTPLALEAFLLGALEPTSHDHDVIAHALNERCVELGGNHSVPYAADETHRPEKEDE